MKDERIDGKIKKVVNDRLSDGKEMGKRTDGGNSKNGINRNKDVSDNTGNSGGNTQHRTTNTTTTDKTTHKITTDGDRVSDKIKVPEEEPIRFHRNKYPKPGSIVIGRNTKITDLGVYIKLLEYGNVEGLVVIGELSKKRIRNIQKLIKLNKLEVCSVLRVDEEKGFIDLSRKKVVESDYNECYKRYLQNKVSHNIIVSISQRIGVPIMELYKKYFWDKADEYNSLYEYFGQIHSADGMKDGVKENKLSVLLKGVPLEIHPLLIQQIQTKYNIQKVKVRADIDITSRKGIEVIKESLREALRVNDSLEILLVKPPTYSISITTSDQNKGREIITESINRIKEYVLGNKGTYEEVSLKVYGLKDRKIDDDISDSD